MTPAQFRHIKYLIGEYMDSLELESCKLDLLNKGILTTNLKLAKGDTQNFGLELLPSVLSSVNTCPSAGMCKYICLAFSGIGNILKSKKMLDTSGIGHLSDPLKAKARRTYVWIKDPSWFEALLKAEILHKDNIGRLLNKSTYFRLNVTSDITWFHITNELKEINFYDYTKVWDRESTTNYRLTYSYSEHISNDQVMSKIKNGDNVAMVFLSRRLPVTYYDIPVIDGDINDDRSNDPIGVIVGLTAKTTVGGKDVDSIFFLNA